MDKIKLIMKNNKEYDLSWQIAAYLRVQYPKVIYHFDYAGLNLSKAQAGKMKAIQGRRGFPDLMILEPKGLYHGLFIELKAASIFKQDGEIKKDAHLYEQRQMLHDLSSKGYYCMFGIGFDNCKAIIDNYMNKYNTNHAPTRD